MIRAISYESYRSSFELLSRLIMLESLIIRKCMCLNSRLSFSFVFIYYQVCLKGKLTIEI